MSMGQAMSSPLMDNSHANVSMALLGSNEVVMEQPVATTSTANFYSFVSGCFRRRRSDSESGNNASTPCEIRCVNSPVSNSLVEYRRQLQVFQRSGNFCDCKLKTQSGEILLAHKFILASISPYCMALFTHSKESSSRQVEGQPMLIQLPCDFDREVLSVVLDYAYTWSTEGINATNVQDVLVAADVLLIESLALHASCAMCSYTNESNCIAVWNFASNMPTSPWMAPIKLHAEAFALKNFGKVTDDELFQLSIEKITSLLQDDRLNVTSERHVFETALRWIEVDSDIRSVHIADLLSCIRFGFVGADYFFEKIKSNPYVLRHLAACRSILEVGQRLFSDYLLAGSNLTIPPIVSSRLLNMSRNISTRPRFPHSFAIAFGGWSGGSCTSKLESYDWKADKWSVIGDIDKGPRAYQATVVLNSLVYMIGGFDGTDQFSTCSSFDAESSVWDEIAPMHRARCYVSACVLNGKIYAMGGCDRSQRLNSVECYNPANNQWTYVAKMNAKRSDADCAVIDGKIYIAGGFDGTECLQSAEVYDPTTDTWRILMPMSQRRSGVSCCAGLDGCFYVFGGFNGTNRLDTCERFNPLKNYWSAIAPMKMTRSNFGVTLLENKILVCGGFNGHTTVAQCELYDFETNEWSMAGEMNLDRSAVSCCTLESISEFAPSVENMTRFLYPRSNLFAEISRRIVSSNDPPAGGHQDAPSIVVPTAAAHRPPSPPPNNPPLGQIDDDNDDDDDDDEEEEEQQIDAEPEEEEDDDHVVVERDVEEETARPASVVDDTIGSNNNLDRQLNRQVIASYISQNPARRRSSPPPTTSTSSSNRQVASSVVRSQQDSAEQLQQQVNTAGSSPHPSPRPSFYVMGRVISPVGGPPAWTRGGRRGGSAGSSATNIGWNSSTNPTTSSTMARRR